MQTIPQVSEAMQHVLTSVAERAGRQTSFVQRQSKVTGSIFTQTLVFGLLANPRRPSTASLRPLPPWVSSSRPKV